MCSQKRSTLAPPVRIVFYHWLWVWVLLLTRSDQQRVQGLTLIGNCTQLQGMQANLTETYQLTQNIDCAATVNWNTGAGFVPIGDSTRPFLGKLNGNHYEIRDLTIYRPSVDYVGLFGYVGVGAKIDDIGLIFVDVTGGTYAGGLIGYADRANLTKCYTKGSIISLNSYSYAGGLLGYNAGGIISQSYSTGSVSSTSSYQSYAGGLVSYSAAGTISQSYATGSVYSSTADLYAYSYAGGLVAYNDGGTIIQSYTIGSVSSSSSSNSFSESSAGGLVAYNNGGIVSQSYATGSVSSDSDSDSYAGGLVGYYTDGTIIQSYATGRTISSSSSSSQFDSIAGGLIGYNTGSSSSSQSYWDTQASGQPTSDGGIGKPTFKMMQQATFLNWDFTIWWVNEDIDYPRLRGVNSLPSFVINPIQNQLATIGVWFSFVIPNNTMENPGDCCLEYQAQLFGGSPLPFWLTYTSITRNFVGTPGSNDEGSIIIEVLGVNDHGDSTPTTFVLNVVKPNINQPPKVVNQLSNQNANVGNPFRYTVPLETFADPNGGTLLFSAKQFGESSLPRWLHFDPPTRIFDGTPSSKDTDLYADKQHFIEVCASDNTDETCTGFLLTVKGKSMTEEAISALLIIFSIASTLFGIYSNRAWLWNKTARIIYQQPNQEVIVGSEFYYQFKTSLERIYRIQAFKDGNPLPNNQRLPSWLANDKNNITLLKGTPRAEETLWICAFGYDERILEAFILICKKDSSDNQDNTTGTEMRSSHSRINDGSSTDPLLTDT